MRYPNHLNKLIDVLRKLPGVGSKSAERYAFHMLDWPQEQMENMAQIIQTAKENLKCCSSCGCIMDNENCLYCNNPSRDKSTLCIIASPKDAFSLEATGEFRGLYHVLDTLLSPLDGKNPEDLVLSKLTKRLDNGQVSEIIIALDSTLEGDATTLFLEQELSRYNINVSRLAFGLPMGSSLDYVDGGTLAQAFVGRNLLKR